MVYEIIPKKYTLQGINISHLGKRKIIFKMPFLGDMLVFRGVTVFFRHPLYIIMPLKDQGRPGFHCTLGFGVQGTVAFRRLRHNAVRELQDGWVAAIIPWISQKGEAWGRSTLPETNIAPENRPSQKETSIPTIHFQVLC